MDWLQIRPFGSYFSSFSTNSYGYYSQMRQNLSSNDQIFALALIVRQAARRKESRLLKKVADKLKIISESRQTVSLFDSPFLPAV